jgi:anti-sigma regulatory factor (Ser/Thr protein kinase)
VVFIQRERLTRSVVMAEKLDREIKLARDIQMSTLPSDMPRVRGYDMAGQFCPADDTGGDTFDLVPLDDGRLFVLLGDASGHGIGPALSSTQMTGMLRVALRLGADLDSIFSQVNNQLVEDLPEEHFVTAFLGMLDPARHRIEYHAAGQGPLMHYRAATGEFEWRSPTTFPMGYMRYPSLDAPAEIKLDPGDVLALVTDGAYEYEDPDGHPFGTEGVERVVAAHHFRPAAEQLALLLDALHDHARGAPQADDVTIVLLRRVQEGGAATTVQRYFRRSFDSLDSVFGYVEDFLRAKGLDPGLREPVNFIVEELFTNMVKYNPGNTHDIAVSLGCTREALTVRLTDFDVDPFDVTRAPVVDVDKPLSERQIGGLGLHLVRQMADTLRYEFADRRSTITFTMALG